MKQAEDFTTWRERMRRETAGLPYDGPDAAAIRASARALWQEWQAQQVENGQPEWQAQQAEEQTEKQTEIGPQERQT